jgi:DNA-binding MarR family transcriptional regulator
MAKKQRQPTSADGSPAGRPPYTAKQGQYLAFIHCYQKVHRRAPSEADLQQYFRVSPPSIHDMILRLEEQGLIARVPGQARSIRILLPPEQLPDLES